MKGKIKINRCEDVMGNATNYLEKGDYQNSNTKQLIEDYLEHEVTDRDIAFINNDKSFPIKVPPYLRIIKNNKEIILMHPYLFAVFIFWLDYHSDYTTPSNGYKSISI